jgi:hypothetical protein
MNESEERERLKYPSEGAFHSTRMRAEFAEKNMAELATEWIVIKPV